MIKKTRIISVILLSCILSLNFSKSLTTYADSSALNYDSKYDINHDSIINKLDIDEISKHYNTQKDSPNWTEKFDFNNDGIIDIFDIIKISKRNGIKKPEKKLSKNALELQNLLSANKNVTTAKDEAGKTIYNVWVKGITPPSENDFTDIDLGNDYSIKVAPWKSGQGWYDINKVRGDSGDDLLCSGAVATNMLHWWFDQNNEFINKYLSQGMENGKNIAKDLDIRTSSTFHNQQNSDIFNLIKKFFGHNKPIWTDRTLLWYLNGFNMDFSPGQNYGSPHIDQRGGFFHDIFKSIDIIDRSTVTKFDVLNMRLLQWLKEDRALGIAHKTFSATTNHIITVWGTSFDENGTLIGIYTTDSDDGSFKMSDGSPYGMRYSKVIKDSNGLARITNYNGKNNNIGARTLELFSFSLERDKWEEYFNKDNN